MAEQPGLKTEQAEGVTIVSFQAAPVLDTLTTQRIARQLYELVEGARAAKILLDFEQVRFLASQALGVLLTLRRKADKAGARIAVARIRPELVRVFQITTLDKLFDFFESIEDAITKLNEA